MKNIERTDQDYIDAIKGICMVFHANKPTKTIYRTNVGKAWQSQCSQFNNNIAIPGDLMTRAMKEFAQEKGRIFDYETGPRGDFFKIRII